MTRAKFITLDGIDGAGKTTHLNNIKQWFEQRNLAVVFSREPGGTVLGEQLRALLLNPESHISLEAETLMMFAARSQHLSEVILPALQNGIHVVCDRFTDATFAYQGGGRGLAVEKIALLEQWVQQDLQPDLTLLLDVPLEISMMRVAQTREKDRFEQEQADFFNRVRQNYLQRAHQYPNRCRIIDNSRDLNEVRIDIESQLDALFGFTGAKCHE